MAIPVKAARLAAAPHDSRHVDPEGFLECALARTRWERAVHPQAGLTELVSPDGSDSVVIDSVELDRFRLLPR